MALMASAVAGGGALMVSALLVLEVLVWVPQGQGLGQGALRVFNHKKLSSASVNPKGVR
jgi:hypothetical protein